MNKILDIKIERTFGELLGDGMKLVFRHLGSMGLLLLTYAMPFVAVAIAFIILTGSITTLTDPESWVTDEGFANIFSTYIIIGLGVGASVIMMNLIVYGTVITYFEYDGNVSADKISVNIKKYLGSYLISILTQIAIGFLMLGAVSLFAMISPVLFGIAYFIMIFVAVWVFNVIQFLGIVRIEEGLTVVEGLKKCFYLLQNQWWETFGLVVITSLLGSLLMYGIIILFVVVFSVFAGVYNTNAFETPSIVTYIIYGVFSFLYILIMSASNMYLAGVRILKYYDLTEKKEARNLIAAIEEIGQAKNNLFENEGEY